MKFSKAALAGLGVTAGVLCLMAGWFLRDWTGGDSYRVESGGARRQSAVYPADFTPDEPVDLNSATLAQLMGLPHIGQTRAQAILDYREEKGPFTYPEEVIAVPGIGVILYEEISDYITALPIQE